MNPLWLISRPAIILYACIALYFTYDHWSSKIADRATASCQNEQEQASSDHQAKARADGDKAVQGAIDANNSNKPAVTAAVDGLRNLSTSAACRVFNRPSSGGISSADTQAEIDRAREAQAEIQRKLNDASDDIQTCAEQLNLFEGAQKERASLVTPTQQPKGE